MMSGISEDIKVSKKKLLKTGRRKIQILFYLTSIAYVFCLSSLISLQMLQTSIHIEGNIGAISSSAAYLSSILFNVFCTPALLQYMGPNVAVIIAEFCFFIYCLANIYPELAVLTAGAIISGVGRSILMPTYTILVIRIAEAYSELDTSKSYERHYKYFQSIFYVFLECSSIVGNSLSYAILYGFSASHTPSEGIDFTTSTPNWTTTDQPNNNYEHCGVNDCQDPEVIEENIDQYVPPDKTSVIILIATSCGLSVVAALMHGIAYPGVGVYSHRLTKIKQKALQSDVTSTSIENNNNNSELRDKANDKTAIPYENGSFETESVASSQQTDDTQLDFAETTNTEIHKKRNDSYLEILKDTGKFSIYPRPLMLHVQTLRHGMMLGFIIADVTRAYASCVAGVETVGLFLVALGFSSVISAFLNGKFNFKHSRYVILATSCTLEFLMYIGCYFWIPDPETTWILFIIFIGFGFANGLFRQNMIATYITHFPEKQNVSFSVFNIYFMGGIGTSYVLSTFACVRTKIIIQVSLLVLCTILLVIAELIRVRKTKAATIPKPDDENGTKL